jgi:hypothetical protein
MDGCELLHVTPGPSRSDSAKAHEFQILGIPSRVDTQYGQLMLRPAPGALPANGARSSSFSYKRMSESELKRAIPASRPIFLDIDLDFFAMLRSRPAPVDSDPGEDLGAAVAAIDRVADALDHAELSQRVAVVTIAYSPGFFPSAWWHVVVPRLREKLRRVLVPNNVR